MRRDSLSGQNLLHWATLWYLKTQTDKSEYRQPPSGRYAIRESPNIYSGRYGADWPTCSWLFTDRTPGSNRASASASLRASSSTTTPVNVATPSSEIEVSAPDTVFSRLNRAEIST